jgi:hypothetical protein
VNWNAVGAIGQILGSLATFVTVGYLVVQVNDTERETKRAIAQNRTERTIGLNLALATNERLADIHIKGNEAVMLGKPRTPQEIPPEIVEALKPFDSTFLVAAITKLGLTPQETTMLSAELSARWAHVSQTILYVDELPPGERSQFDRTNRNSMSEPLVRFWFEYSKSSFSPDAVRYIENLLALPTNDFPKHQAEGTR